jgi:formylglycine-generating enzyme required for sulfatase activity
LPTEAEWEYACRAGTNMTFSFDEPNYNSGNCFSCTPGNHPILEQYSVYCANDSNGAEVVGSKLPNPAGLYDMHGNVFERVWDYYESYPSGSVTDPTGASSGSVRVSRGGSFISAAHHCRSASRYTYSPPDFRYNYLGFRLVRTSP